ncbi:MAG: phosphotriesterase-related protein [Dehalococcoidia bacterium]|nr:phosphotriesterase-related protein [Dehalococcoidia bacterium]
MPQVQAVTGPIDTASFGFTLMHEHVVTRSPGLFEAWPHLWDRAKEVQRAITLLRQAKEAGIDTMIDLTTIDLGRDVAFVREVAEQVDVKIVMCTGVWRNPPRDFTPADAEEIAGLFVRDIEQGMEGGTIRAGVIKLATEPDVDELNEKILRAGARAHRRTGVPISTHHYVHTQCGLSQQNIFEDEGVDLSRVVIGHSGDSEDDAYLKSIMDRGSTIGMDRFGIDRMLSTEKRTATVARLCKAGYADRMVLSHDANSYMDTTPPDRKAEIMPNWHYLHITNDVLPALREQGVSEDDIRKMTVDNPRRIFEQQGAY